MLNSIDAPTSNTLQYIKTNKAVTPIEIPKSDNPRVPDPCGPYRHYMPLQIRFTDIDMLGHLNNAIFVNFFDMGKTNYFSTVRKGPLSWDTISLVIVNINCSFFAPVYFTDKVEVYTKTVEIGERSVTMDQRIVNTETGVTHAMCRTVLAGFDIQNHCGIPVTDEWRRMITQFEQMK